MLVGICMYVDSDMYVGICMYVGRDMYVGKGCT